jgi:hypothetical protein
LIEVTSASADYLSLLNQLEAIGKITLERRAKIALAVEQFVGWLGGEYDPDPGTASRG